MALDTSRWPLSCPMCRWCERDDSGEDGRTEMFADGVEQVLDWVSFSLEAGHTMADIHLLLETVTSQVGRDASGIGLN